VRFLLFFYFCGCGHPDCFLKGSSGNKMRKIISLSAPFISNLLR
jgi:hypothetical protein